MIDDTGNDGAVAVCEYCGDRRRRAGGGDKPGNQDTKSRNRGKKK